MRTWVSFGRQDTEEEEKPGVSDGFVGVQAKKRVGMNGVSTCYPSA